MKRMKFRNIAKVSLHGKQPGEVFLEEVSPDGAPVALLWRKRLKEGAIEVVKDDPPKPKPAKSKESDASPEKTSAKKG